MPTPPDKISIQIYRHDRQRIAEIEAEMTKEWAASGGDVHGKPTVADAVTRALDRASRADRLKTLLDELLDVALIKGDLPEIRETARRVHLALEAAAPGGR